MVSTVLFKDTGLGKLQREGPDANGATHQYSSYSYSCIPCVSFAFGHATGGDFIGNIIVIQVKAER